MLEDRDRGEPISELELPLNSEGPRSRNNLGPNILTLVADVPAREIFLVANSGSRVRLSI